MRTEASFVRPFQIVLDLSLAATMKLHAVRPPTYQKELVRVMLDGVSINGPVWARKMFTSIPDIPPQAVHSEVWSLHTERFYLNDYGKLVAKWPDDLCGVVSVRTYDVVRDFYTDSELASLADELIDIVASRTT